MEAKKEKRKKILNEKRKEIVEPREKVRKVKIFGQNLSIAKVSFFLKILSIANTKNKQMYESWAGPVTHAGEEICARKPAI